MIHLKSCYMDKQALRAIGCELWKLRQEKHMYLHTIAYQTKLPERIIEGMEIGKFLKYDAFRRLMEFYGTKMRIVIE